MPNSEKTIRELNLEDDFLFAKVMSDREICRKVLEKTDTFAHRSNNPLIRDIHKKVIQVRQSKEMEVEYMTLLQRDRENIELGREEGWKEGLQTGKQEGLQAGAKIIRLYLNGLSDEEIAAALQIDLNYVNTVITNFNNE